MSTPTVPLAEGASTPILPKAIFFTEPPPAEGMPIAVPFKPRAATPVDSTDSLPTGTMITVPSVRTSGEMPALRANGQKAPVVAANTVSKWLDPGFLLGLLGCLTGVVTAVIDVLPSSGPIDWRITWPKVALAIIGAVSSYVRQRTNTVTK